MKWIIGKLDKLAEGFFLGLGFAAFLFVARFVLELVGMYP